MEFSRNVLKQGKAGLNMTETEMKPHPHLYETRYRSKKRAQSKTGEVLTKENVLERLAAEESHLKNKFNQVNIKKDLKNTESFKEVKQGSWIEVEYQSRSQSSKFIGQVIDIKEFYHLKYLTKSPLGDYYTFPAIDDEARVEFSDVCRILLEPNFDSPVDIISLIK
ncbi:uncharacterized protein TNIN_283351 [Trichonephila inaurata madagascariensis]|uniref:Uncharacterized protein n=1 Tax=Trichonephila inaurata madagascariensis TaxID=2747483 RepID=A0A8X7BY72_9ARAC|nr:uncharacterized protein TNIN_283351 [Trichonephila inaurata madagascariensis]